MRVALQSIALAVITAACIEATAYWAGSILQSRAILYAPQPVTEARYRDYLHKRDPLLGWPSPSAFGAGEYASSGVRATEDATAIACIAAFGDSFTFGAEVDAEHSWPSLLADRVGCPVANYGVSGYGTDQAYLRFASYESDLPPVVIFGHFQEGMLRNVNQFHGLLNGGESTGFKPRFILDEDGGLERVPLPEFSYAAYRRAIADPAQFLPYEYFAPGGASGLQILRFPFTWSVLKAVRHFSIRARIEGVPRHAVFYDPSHSSGALEITARLLRRFNSEALEAGLEPIVLVLPASRDLEHFQQDGNWAFEPLLDRLREDGVRFENAGGALAARVAQAGSGELFEPGGHYSPFGNEIVAQAIHLRLGELGLVR